MVGEGHTIEHSGPDRLPTGFGTGPVSGQLRDLVGEKEMGV